MGKRYKKRKGRPLHKWELLDPTKKKEEVNCLCEEEKTRREECSIKILKIMPYVAISLGIVAIYLLLIDEIFGARVIEFLLILLGGVAYEMRRKP